MLDRDEILMASDEALSRLCELDFCRGSGPGGQKRNKSSSAARVRLAGTDFTAEDCTERSQHRNRAHALRKLKMSIAFAVRQKFKALDRAGCAVDHADYPLFAAQLLDALSENNWNLPETGKFLEMTPTSLLKTLSRDPQLWQAFCVCRTRAGLSALSPRK